MLFVRGVHVTFPLPTKQLKMPRRTKRRGVSSIHPASGDPVVDGPPSGHDYSAEPLQPEEVGLRSGSQFWEMANFANASGQDYAGHEYRKLGVDHRSALGQDFAREHRKYDDDRYLDLSYGFAAPEATPDFFAPPQGYYAADYPSSPARASNTYAVTHTAVNVNSVITGIGRGEGTQGMNAGTDFRLSNARAHVPEAIGSGRLSYQQLWSRPR